METIFCATCGNECIPEGCTSGYGIDNQGKKHCFACCAMQDAKQMRETGKAVLYLGHGNEVSNWPGTLKIQPLRVSTSRHNIGGKRTDVWFQFENQNWHGVHIGGNNTLLRCKRVK